MSATVTPEGILKELNTLWESLSHADENGVLRACAMTLLIAADEEEEASILGEMVAEVMHNHPSRAIVLRIRDGKERGLESQVLAQCWKPLGKRQQICCEQIEIRSTEGGLVDVPRLVLGLIAPDLPVLLVCRKPHLMELAGFQPLVQMAGKVIVDSRQAENPLAMMRTLSKLRGAGSVADDLAWTAITAWRESIACAFEDCNLLALLHSMRNIRVVHGGRRPSSGAFYIAAWLMRAIGIHSGVEFLEAPCDQTIRGINISGPDFQLDFQHAGGSMLQMVRNGRTHNLPFSESTEWDLVREELSVVGHDRIFEDVLSTAIGLAGEY